MEFKTFKMDGIRVSLAVPDRGPFLNDVEYNEFKEKLANKEYYLSCMKVPPKTAFYKAINWKDKGFKQVPFKINHPQHSNTGQTRL